MFSLGCYEKNTIDWALISCGLNNKPLLLIVLQAVKSKIKTPTDLVDGCPLEERAREVSEVFYKGAKCSYCKTKIKLKKKQQ